MIGILFAITAGVMLGFWAMPGKFVKNYEFENTWGLCYFAMLWVLPLIVAFAMIDNFGLVLADSSSVLLGMFIPGFLWGVGMMFWGKAINYIGLSLGFSIFIGTIICVGSLLPFVMTGLPVDEVEAVKTDLIVTLLAGILVILAGVILNGRAGILRQKAEQASDAQGKKGGSMVTGIIIAVAGGLLCTGFNVALEVQKLKEAVMINGIEVNSVLEQAIVSNGNEKWLASVASMFIVYVSGGIFVVPYFIIMLSKKKLWGAFKVAEAGKNISMTTLMAALNFAASIVFAYSNFLLKEKGGTIGYAIFNTLSVVVAVIGGIIVKEWVSAPSKSKLSLYMGLGAMIIGVVITAIANSL